jgi:hypothetical protein
MSSTTDDGAKQLLVDLNDQAARLRGGATANDPPIDERASVMINMFRITKY